MGPLMKRSMIAALGATIVLPLTSCHVGEAGSTYGTLHFAANDGTGRAVAGVVVAVDYGSQPRPRDQITNESGAFDLSGPEGVWTLTLRDGGCYNVPALQPTEVTARIRRLQTTDVTVVVTPVACEPGTGLP